MNEKTISAARPRPVWQAIGTLVWREWRLTRKEFFSGMSIVIVLTALFWLVRLSMSVGNLAPVFEGSELLGEFNAIIYYSSIGLVSSIAAGCGSNMSALPDIQANWLQYSFALPITPCMRATGIYITKIMKMLIGLLFAVLNILVTAKITGMQVSVHVFWFAAVIFTAFQLYDTLLTFFVTKARTVQSLNRATMKALAVIMVPVLLCSFHNFITDPQADEVESLDEMIERFRMLFLTHESVIRPVTVLVLTGSLLLGWLVTMRHYKLYGDVNEREKEPKKRLFSLFGTQKDGEES